MSADGQTMEEVEDNVPDTENCSKVRVLGRPAPAVILAMIPDTPALRVPRITVLRAMARLCQRTILGRITCPRRDA